jgi:hypothetical protein
MPSQVARKLFGLQVKISPVFGLITEFVPDAEARKPYFEGLVMGMKSAVDWALRDLVAFQGNTINVTQVCVLF